RYLLFHAGRHMEVKIQVPGANLLSLPEDVVANGSIIVFSPSTIAFTLSEAGLAEVYKLEVEIVDDPEQAPATMQSSPLQGPGVLSEGLGLPTAGMAGLGLAPVHGSRLTLRNWGWAAILATSSRVPITPISNKMVYLAFAIQSVGMVRIFHYTFSQ